MAKIQINDFSGGISTYTYNQAPQFACCSVNTLIRKDKSLVVRQGSFYHDTECPFIETQGRINRLECFGSKGLIATSVNDIFYKKDGEWITVRKDGDLPAFPRSNNDTCIQSFEHNNHVHFTTSDYDCPIKVYCNKENELEWVVSGLPFFNQTIDCDIPGTGTNSYVYAFVYCREYCILDSNGIPIDFVDVSAPTYLQCQEVGDIDANTIINLQGFIPFQGGNEYGDVSIKIYRTLANQAGVFYYVDTIDGTTNNYTDSNDDASISANAILYTSGDNGSVEYEPVPKSSASAIVNNTAYYGNGYDIDGTYRPNRLWQAAPNNPDGIIGFIDFEAPIIAISSVDRYPIIFVGSDDGTGPCGIYRLEGAPLTEDGQGQYIVKKIADNITTVSANSIVKTHGSQLSPQGTMLYFAGTGNFYRTNGFGLESISTQRTSDELAGGTSPFSCPNYCDITEDGRAKKIYGVSSKYEERVYWAVQEPGYEDNNAIWVYDERHKAWTDWRNECYPETFKPTALKFVGKDLHRAHQRDNVGSWILKHNHMWYTDPYLPTSVEEFQDIQERGYKEYPDVPIVFRHITVNYDMGTPHSDKVLRSVCLMGKPETSAHIGIKSYKNGMDLCPKKLCYIEHNNGKKWCDQDLSFCDDEKRAAWCFAQPYYKTRKFPRCSKRVCHVKLEFYLPYLEEQEISAVITNTDGVYTAPLGLDKIYQLFDLVIDDVTFRIVSIDDTGLATLMPVGQGDHDANLSATFKLMGYPKNERAQIESFLIDYKPKNNSKGGIVENTKTEGGK